MRYKFRTLQDEVVGLASNSGEPIYEWEYLDEQGETKTDERNVYEMIQSYSRQTDYKARIENGEEINTGHGLYMDISALGDSADGLYGYIADLVARVHSDIQSAQAGEAVKENSKESGTTGQQSAEVNRENQTKGEESK